MKLSDSSSKTEISSEKKANFGKNPLKFPLWLLIFPLMIGGWGLWKMTERNSAPVAQTEQKSPPRPVKVVTISQEEGVKQVKLLGQVEAGETATVRSQTDGLVKQVLVKAGDRVTPGMTLAILEDSDQQVRLSQAQAQLAKEKSQLAKLTVGTRREIINQRQADVNAAIAREQEARANLQSIIHLNPDLIAQRSAELQRAIAREKETLDNLRRIENLAQEGAFSERALVEARTDADTAKSDRLRAESALTAEKIRTRQTEAEAKTTLDEVISQRRRQEALLAEAIAGPTKEEIEAQKGLVAAAEASVKQAQLQLSRVQIKTLTAGVVQSRAVDAGDYVESSDPIITLVSDRQLDIFLEVPESLVSQISPGLTVKLTARALPQWQETTTITAVVPATDPTSRRQLIRLSLANPPQNLLAGMAVQGDLLLPIKTDETTFIIPRDAVMIRREQGFVYRIVEETARQISVEILADMGEKMAISSPQLKLGQRLVITGMEGLKEGSQVKIIDD